MRVVIDMSEKDDSFNIELSYEMVLLKHMDRISKLSIQIMSERFDNMQGWKSEEQHKVNAFVDTVRLFEAFVSEELKDKKYNDELEQLIKEYSKSKNPQLSDYNIYWNDRLKILINLLGRKGKLYGKKQSISISSGTKEIFD